MAINLRDTRDFLLIYNRISSNCFNRCITNFHQRPLDDLEGGCIDRCTKKHMNVNNAVMFTYAEMQPQIIQKKIEEAEKQQAALQQNSEEPAPQTPS